MANSNAVQTFWLLGINDICKHFTALFVKPACGERDRVVTASVWNLCIHCACIRLDLPGLYFVALCMDFELIWHSCFP